MGMNVPFVADAALQPSAFNLKRLIIVIFKKYRIDWMVRPHLAGVVPLILFAAVMLLLFTRQQESAIRSLLQTRAESLAFIIDRTVGEQAALLRGLATSGTLDRGDLAAFRLEAERLWRIHPEWYTLVLTDRHGPVFNLRIPEGTPLPPLADPASLKQVWESRKFAVGNHPRAYITVRVPVLRQGRVVHTLVAVIHAQLLENIIVASTDTREWDVVVRRPRGRDHRLVHPGPRTEGLSVAFGPAAGDPKILPRATTLRITCFHPLHQLAHPCSGPDRRPRKAVPDETHDRLPGRLGGGPSDDFPGVEPERGPERPPGNSGS